MFFILSLLLVTDWPIIIPVVEKSVPRLEMSKNGQSGTCSAVVFLIEDGYASALTAAHCVEHGPTERLDITANDRNAIVVSFNNILDIAIIRFRTSNSITAIPFASSDPVIGEDVSIIGYAFGVSELVAQFGRVAQPFNRESKSLWVDAIMIFGDSGGAVINLKGELVGITSRIYSGGSSGQMAHIGAAVPIDAIKDFVENYKNELEKAKRKDK